MLRSTRVQMIAMLGIGGLLGYAAASGKIDAFRKVNAEPSQLTLSQKARGFADDSSACCSAGSTRGELVALADPKGIESRAQGQQLNSDRPNILFIMGDDIGWMQPGCYHRGLMVGETPNIDRIGNEGARCRCAGQWPCSGRCPSLQVAATAA